MEAIVILLVVDKNLLLTISSILYYEVQTKTEGMFALHVILKVHYHKVVAHSLKLRAYHIRMDVQISEFYLSLNDFIYFSVGKRPLCYDYSFLLPTISLVEANINDSFVLSFRDGVN